jgi:hypothetical protein
MRWMRKRKISFGSSLLRRLRPSSSASLRNAFRTRSCSSRVSLMTMRTVLNVPLGGPRGESTAEAEAVLPGGPAVLIEGPLNLVLDLGHGLPFGPGQPLLLLPLGHAAHRLEGRPGDLSPLELLGHEWKLVKPPGYTDELPGLALLVLELLHRIFVDGGVPELDVELGLFGGEESPDQAEARDLAQPMLRPPGGTEGGKHSQQVRWIARSDMVSSLSRGCSEGSAAAAPASPWGD